MADLPPQSDGTEPPTSSGGMPPFPAYGVPMQPQVGGAWYPISGYQVPGGTGYFDPTTTGTDPLVVAFGQAYNGWWSRLWKTFARSWRSILPIFVLTSGLPGLAFAFFEAHALSNLNANLQQQSQTGQFPSAIGTFYEGLFVYLVISALLSGIGWSAAMWTITKQAVGDPAPFGSAMAFGFRKFLRVGGWIVLYSLMVVIGSVCCLLPGLYLGVAGSLVVPVVIFRHGASMSDSFRLVHGNFGAVLGRVATLAGFVVATSGLAFIVGQVVGVVAGAGNFGATAIGGVLGVVIGLPTSILLVIGILLTYAELSAREGPMDSATLNAAL